MRKILKNANMEGEMMAVKKVKRYRATRTSPVIRKEMIICSALQLAARIGYNKVTLPLVSREAKVSHVLVLRYFKSIKKLQNEILKSAVDKKMHRIVAQGLAFHDPIILRTSKKIKKQAAESLPI